MNRLSSVAALFVIGVVLAGCSCPHACWTDPPVQPVTLEVADIYRDGGTLFVVFVDARGCEYRITHDRQIGPERPRCLYINAMHPTDSDAELLDPAGTVAAAVAACLDDWVNRIYSDDVVERIGRLDSFSGTTADDRMLAHVLDMIATIRSGPCTAEGNA